MRQPRVVGELPDVFVGAHAVAAGLLTPDQLRGPHVVRVLRGVYRPRWVRDTHELRCRAAALLAPDTALFTGRSAATWLGCTLAGVRDPVEILVPESSRFGGLDGVRVRRVEGDISAGAVVRGLPLTTPHRTAFDLAARRPLHDSVAMLDAFGRKGFVQPAELRSWLQTQHQHDVRHVRNAAELMDPRAESVRESHLRVHLAVAGIALEPQYRVFHGGRVIARLDLADAKRRVGVEYDGRWHALVEQFERDRARLNLLHQAGWVLVHVTNELLARPRALVDEVRRALSDADARAAARRPPAA